jgi:hypothetical protein
MNPAEPEMKDGGELDAGEPITALATFEHDTFYGLFGGVRQAIHRRTTVAHLASFLANAPFVVVREFWAIVIGQLKSKNSRKGDDRENPTR